MSDTTITLIYNSMSTTCHVDMSQFTAAYQAAQPTWGPLTVTADSYVSGSGLRACTASGEWIFCGVSLRQMLGSDHPAVVEADERTGIMRDAQRSAGRRLAAILDDERRFLRF